MKKLATTLFLGKDARLSGLLAFAIVGAVALGCTCSKDLGSLDTGNSSNSSNSSTTSNTSTTTDSDGLPSDSTMQSMVKDLTADFAEAIDTNDFSTIYNNASQDFKHQYTEQQMNDEFKEFVQKKKLIVPILNKATSSTPEFSPAPRIREESGLDILVLNGKFPGKPQLKFEYEFVKRAGEWKMLKLVVNLG